MNKTHITVSARDLVIGDVLLGSRETVLGIWNHGVSIPTGKCELVLERESGKTRRTTFRKNTAIRVERTS